MENLDGQGSMVLAAAIGLLLAGALYLMIAFYHRVWRAVDRFVRAQERIAEALESRK